MFGMLVLCTKVFYASCLYGFSVCMCVFFVISVKKILNFGSFQLNWNWNWNCIYNLSCSFALLDMLGRWICMMHSRFLLSAPLHKLWTCTNSASSGIDKESMFLAHLNNHVIRILRQFAINICHVVSLSILRPFAAIAFTNSHSHICIHVHYFSLSFPFHSSFSAFSIVPVVITIPYQPIVLFIFSLSSVFTRRSGK